MRATTVLRRLIGVTELIVDKMLFTIRGELSVTVRPRWRKPRCGQCGRQAPGYDRRPSRRWQHLPLGRTRIVLSYEPLRVRCRRCGIRVERVPWADHGSRFTKDFEELVAYLAQVTDKTKVTKLTGIAWPTVGSIVDRVVQNRLDPGRLEDLRRIGVDEFSYRKRHRYLTIVVDHERRRVVWAAEGRSAEVLGRFFELLGPERCRQIELATIDMAGGYIKAIREWLPDATIVFDRFHVERLVLDALDEVRRSLVRELQGPDAKHVKNTRYLLLMNPWRLSPGQQRRLADIQRSHKPLFRAYLLKESFAEALEEEDPHEATAALEHWLAWASRSRLKPFVKAARTVRTHFDGIVAYLHTRCTNALVEGLNTRLRMIARRAYGFHSAEALIAMLFLVCGGIELSPPLPTRC